MMLDSFLDTSRADMTDATSNRRQFAYRSACALLGASGFTRPAHAATPLIVFAAASLTEVLQTIASTLPAANTLRFSFASSSTLAKQIEQGAPAHVFISADDAWMDHLVARQAVDAATRVNLANNRLVVVREGAPLAATALETNAALRNALRPRLPTGSSTEKNALQRIATGDPAHVPVGRYAQAALTQLGLWAEVGPRLVRADNVRSALSFVERGEVAAGIVYATDATATTTTTTTSGKVQVAAHFPLSSHPPIRYPAAVVSKLSASTALAAKEFLMVLSGAASQPFWRAAGFTVAS
jgi:molybdate transport system substrate-binding protein